MNMDGQYLDEMILSTIKRYQIELEKERPLGYNIRVYSQDVRLMDREIYPDIYMRLPRNFILREKNKAKSGYIIRDHPEKILTSGCGSVHFTFDKISDNTVKRTCEDIKRIMSVKYPHHIIYECGEIENEKNDQLVSWFDFKSSAADSDVYNIMFLLEHNEDTIIGTFKCPFTEYQVWKKFILKMIVTIEIKSQEEFADEGLL